MGLWLLAFGEERDAVECGLTAPQSRLYLLWEAFDRGAVGVSDEFALDLFMMQKKCKFVL